MERISKKDKNMLNEKWEDTWIPALCEGFCADNPCALRVHRINGVAVNVEPNTEGENFQQHAKGHGTLCAKAFTNIQKIYNPHRIKGPLKRTNPEKGIGIDPKWVSISWDEALDTIAGKLKEIRKRGYAVYSTICHILCLATYNHLAWYRMTIYGLLHESVEE